MNLTISKLTGLPDDIQEIIEQSSSEGFRMIQRMKDEWDSGKNRFDKPGEALWEVRQGSQIAGICGLNRDPYTSESSVGRIRRMYVLPEHRRSGTGRLLVEAALDHAADYFQSVQLRSTPEADDFYVAVGFQKTNEVIEVTHRVQIG